MILEKMRSYLWKLELGFWTYSLMCFLGPSGPNVVFWPQTPKSWNFLTYHILLESFYHSGENEVLSMKIGARVLDLWLDKSLAKSFWPKLPWTSILAPDPKCHSFEIQIFFMSSSINFAWNKYLFSNFGSFLINLWV